MNVRYVVTLAEADRKLLDDLTHKGEHPARKLARARVLLLADGRANTDEEISRATGVSVSTVYRTKARFVEGGVEHALAEATRPGGLRKLSAEQEATLVALACSAPPEGRAKWTLQLLADQLVVLTDLEALSAETVRRRLQENELKPWQKRMWCIPEIDAEFVANMEDVLELYHEREEQDRPLVCFDETPAQLVAETRVPIPATLGQTARFDYEYERRGMANVFMFVAPWRGWRHAKVTDRKTNADFAECMRDLVDLHFPAATRIRVVMDNLSTHRPAALYKAFPAAEARRILRRLEFHYTPKHGSWLNMAEIEIGIMNRQCLDRRIPDKEKLAKELAAWEAARNHQKVKIDWLFDVAAARTKLGRSYPAPERSESASEAA